MEDVPKTKHKFSAIEDGRSMVSPPPRFEVPTGEKMIATSINAAKEGHKRPTVMELPTQESLNRARDSSDSIASIASHRPMLFISTRRDELALKVLSMLPLEVQTVTSTSHKFWTD